MRCTCVTLYIYCTYTLHMLHTVGFRCLFAMSLPVNVIQLYVHLAFHSNALSVLSHLFSLTNTTQTSRPFCNALCCSYVSFIAEVLPTWCSKTMWNVHDGASRWLHCLVCPWNVCVCSVFLFCFFFLFANDILLCCCVFSWVFSMQTHIFIFQLCLMLILYFQSISWSTFRGSPFPGIARVLRE